MAVVSRDAELFFQHLDQQPPTRMYPAWVVDETNGKVQFQTGDERTGSINANVGDTAAYQRLEGEPFVPGDCVLVAEGPNGPRVLGALQVGPSVRRQREITAYPKTGDPFTPTSIGWTVGAIGVRQNDGFVIGADFGIGHDQVLRGDTTFDSRYYQKSESDTQLADKQRITHWYFDAGNGLADLIDNPTYVAAFTTSGLTLTQINDNQVNLYVNFGTGHNQVMRGDTPTGIVPKPSHDPTYFPWPLSILRHIPARGFGTFTMQAGMMYMIALQRFDLPSIGGIGVDIRTASSGSIQAALWSSEADTINNHKMRPRQRISNVGTISATSTGQKTITFTNVVPDRGAMNFLCLRADATTTVTSFIPAIDTFGTGSMADQRVCAMASATNSVGTAMNEISPGTQLVFDTAILTGYQINGLTD